MNTNLTTATDAEIFAAIAKGDGILANARNAELIAVALTAVEATARLFGAFLAGGFQASANAFISAMFAAEEAARAVGATTEEIEAASDRGAAR